MVIVYQPKIKCKDGGSHFYKNKKYRRLKKDKNVFFSYFISVIPHFSYMDFFRKCSMFRRNIPTEAATGSLLLKKSVLKIFAKFTEKHLCQIFFLLSLKLYLKRDSGADVFL